MADYFWSRVSGKFMDKETGKVWTGATFTGTIREWYEILIEVMVDVERRVLQAVSGESIRGAFWKCDPNTFHIIENSVLFLPREQDIMSQEVGVIVYDYHGYVRNIPVSSSSELRGTAKLILLRSVGGREDEIIGSVKVLDMPEYKL